ncbi:MAG: NAD(P)H-binding protein, partial [candidate division Zixibacteria bacterium]|nr:NAD(P)H-binding protein [candidate division Zixibacteria bacterium]NIW43715.1 NAD(P)H-binding protein [Gammaproteobacteria bacterium]NIR62762.1 NAD(P)H-binding protein [candidate division Zixibacteria bacterium]NIS44833.1 NAD(P)H-binding protein [candidate division Zixibacteria bacterium]NIU12926.1 NAD(P)H-binding protein [candidate division Zixibacteria bacterium]
MNIDKILVLGATGMLGKPVVKHLVEHGYSVRILVRDGVKAAEMFSSGVEIVHGDLTNEDSLSYALAGCDAVHISLPETIELNATRDVIRLVRKNRVQRITYVSATTAMEENKSYPRVAVKLRTESLLKDSGIPYVVFCPTWAMETLPNFARGNQVTIIQGKNPPPLHFFAG